MTNNYSVEEQIRQVISQNYKSVRAFAIEKNIPYTSIMSLFKRGIGNASINTVFKVCKALDIDVNSIETGKIKIKNSLSHDEEAIVQEINEIIRTLSLEDLFEAKGYLKRLSEERVQSAENSADKQIKGTA